MKLQSVKIGGSLARNAGFDAPTCLVPSPGFPLAPPCLWGKLQNLSFLKVSKQVVQKCRFVCQARHFRHSHVSANVSKVVLCGRHNNLALFSEDQLNSSWQAQHFGDLHRHFVWQARHFRCVALPALHYTLYTLHSALHTPPLNFTLYTPRSTLYTPH